MWLSPPQWLTTYHFPLSSLVGVSGITITDRILGTNYGDQLREKFKHALETEFTDPDGSILPIRSELTGFTVSIPIRFNFFFWHPASGKYQANPTFI